MTTQRKNDLNLILGSHTQATAKRIPKYADSFTKRVNDDIHRSLTSFFDKTESVKASGRYTEDGERKEIALAASAVRERLAKVRADTVEKLDGQIASKLAARPAPATKDPAMAMVAEMRAQELRAHLRTMDPLDLQTVFKSIGGDAAGLALLDAAENAPPGFPIAPAELVAAARERIAVSGDPEISELAELRASYAYALGVAEEALKDGGGNLGEAEPAPADPREPYLMSTGKPVGQ